MPKKRKKKEIEEQYADWVDDVYFTDQEIEEGIFELARYGANPPELCKYFNITREEFKEKYSRTFHCGRNSLLLSLKMWQIDQGREGKMLELLGKIYIEAQRNLSNDLSPSQLLEGIDALLKKSNDDADDFVSL